LGLAAYPTDSSGRTAAERGEYRIHPESVKIYITLSVPVGQRVRLTSNQFRIHADDYRETISFDGFRLERERRDFAADDELLGASRDVPWIFGTTRETAFYAGHFTDRRPALTPVLLTPVFSSSSAQLRDFVI